MVTVSLPIEVFFFGALFVLVGGKMMQASGIIYARGKDWHMITLAAALCLWGPVFGLGLTILVQNVQ